MNRLRTALTRVINDYAKKNKLLKENEDNLTGEDVREGLTAVISVKHPNPQFEGQTKTKLGNSEVVKITNRLFSDAFSDFLLEIRRLLRKLLKREFWLPKRVLLLSEPEKSPARNLV